MKRPTIKLALSASLGLIAVSVISFAAVAITGLNKLDTNAKEIAEVWLPKISLSREMETALSDLRRSYLNHVVALNEEARQGADKASTDELALLRDQIKRYDQYASEPDEETLLAKINAGLNNFETVGKAVIEMSSAGKKDDAVRKQQGELKPLATEIGASLDGLIEINKNQVAATNQGNTETADFTIAMAIAVLIGCLIVVAAAICFALQGVAKPIEQITAAMKRLARGQTADEIPFGGRADEIGSMAAAVEVFRANALANKELEAEALRTRSMSEQEREQQLARDRQKAAEMKHAADGLAEGLSQLASGKLGFRLNTPFASEFETLRANFNASLAQLAEAMTEVSNSASSIDTGSSEITEAAGDLSRRTENQAASLEETAAALEEISANVSNSSKRTEEARAVAENANSSAEKSRGIVANAIQAMGRIEASSSQISSIISVIDEIAFQTNLLALNAGVEAARAGEAGKGFAVVAQEVRELAQRSAKAAKEISALIAVSTTEVKGGVELVQNTGTALEAISTHIVTMNEHMKAISNSYKEQSVGLAEVNTAVNQMDQVTQQNAAMVEQTSAASATLAQEASRLRSLIQTFDLGGSVKILRRAA